MVYAMAFEEDGYAATQQGDTPGSTAPRWRRCKGGALVVVAVKRDTHGVIGSWILSRGPIDWYTFVYLSCQVLIFTWGRTAPICHVGSE